MLLYVTAHKKDSLTAYRLVTSNPVICSWLIPPTFPQEAFVELDKTVYMSTDKKMPLKRVAFLHPDFP